MCGWSRLQSGLWQFLLAAAIVSLPHLQTVRSEVVAGCDGHLCSTGAPSRLMFTQEEEATVHARCYVTCLEEIATPGQEMKARSNNSAWPTVPLEDLNGNCIEMRKLMECRRACAIRNSVEPRLTRRACRDSCKASCNSDCPSGVTCFYNSTTCRFNCGEKEGCSVGCGIVLSDVDTGPTVDPPAPLVLSEWLVKLPRPPGHYVVHSYPVPTHTESALCGLLLKVEINSTEYFLFQASLFDEVLDLSYLACQSLTVSFAVVTADTISQFSPVTETCVHGATRYPPQLKNDKIEHKILLDDREGFQHNAKVNISWEKPEEAHLITHYEVIMFPTDPECTAEDSEMEIYSGIAGQASYFLVRAFAPERLPRIGCSYQFSLQVLPNNTASLARGFVDIRDPSSVIPSIVLECTTETNEITGLISAEANWYIPQAERYPSVVNAIDFYSVSYNWIDSGSITFIANFDPNQDASGSYVERNLRPSSSIISISIYPHQFPNATPKPLPGSENCELTALPHAPDAVNSFSIVVNKFTIQFNELASYIQMNVSWEEPKRPYGRIANYQVRLLHNAAMSTDKVTAAMEVFKTHENTTIVSGQVITESNAHVATNEPCVYLQVRAKNEFLSWGNWSDTVPVQVNPNAPGTCERFLPPGVTLDLSGLGEAVTVLPVEAWIGVSIGGFAVIILCIACTSVCICICKRHRMRMQMKRAFNENGYQNPMFVAGRRALQRRNSSMRTPFTLTQPAVELDEWEIPVNSVIVDTKFGEGCFGEVHRGVVRGPLPSTRTMKSKSYVTVAIKMLKSSATGSERTDFLHEIDTMKKIAEGNNPHVITFIGCVTVQEPLCLITEFVKYGDLLSYLETIRNLVMQKNRQRKLARIAGLREPEPYLEPRKQNHTTEPAAPLLSRPRELDGAVGGAVGGDVSGDESEMMSVVPSPDSPYADLGGVEPESLISFAYQIASGMEYLSSLDIVHRDLACRNILIGENKNLKISDFGMSRVVSGDDIYVKTSKGRLPWKWMAIESIINREFTHASDVWSYGVTLWEIATLGGFPYPMISNAELLDHLKRGFRLECPDNCSSEIYKVMLECWSENPNERKTFPELRSLFDAMLAKNNPYIQFENINSHKAYYNTTQSQRNSRIEIEDENTMGLSESEIDFEASSTSTVTLNGASANGAYDYLRPLVPNVEVPSAVDEHGQALHVHNPYVETPTFKYLMNQDSFELSNFELELERIQQLDEMESSTDVQVEINTSANAAIIVE